MQIHGLIAFHLGAVLVKARATAFDLDAAIGFSLDMLDVRTTLADNLSSKIEAWDWLEVDGDLFVGPFALARFVS